LGVDGWRGRWDPSDARVNGRIDSLVSHVQAIQQS
jgi:hypothetical protein